MSEPSLNLEPWQFQQHFACFGCRKAFKTGGEFVLDADGGRVRRVVGCPDCGKPMVPMGRQFRAPKRAAVNAWARLAELAASTLDPPFEQARAGRRRPDGCLGCGSLTGGDGHRCPYCGHECPRRPS